MPAVAVGQLPRAANVRVDRQQHAHRQPGARDIAVERLVEAAASSGRDERVEEDDRVRAPRSRHSRPPAPSRRARRPRVSTRGAGPSSTRGRFRSRPPACRIYPGSARTFSEGDHVSVSHARGHRRRRLGARCLGSAGAALPKLVGTVGPGFTISLKQNGKAVKTLKAGTYSITVTDKSDIHNFRLKGPGLNKEITAIDFDGHEDGRRQAEEGDVHLRLRPAPHRDEGEFKVV